MISLSSSQGYSGAGKRAIYYLLIINYLFIISDIFYALSLYIKVKKSKH